MSLTSTTIQSTGSGWLLDSTTGLFGAATLLNAATAVGYSTVLDLGEPSNSVILSTVVTGAPTAVEVIVEGGRYDTGNWTVLANSVSTTGDCIRVGAGVRYLRVHLVQLTGGTSPTVTAVVAALGI